MALRGSIDGLSRFQVVGWARDDTWPDERVDLVVSSGGRVLGRVRADSLRLDLAAAGYGDGMHGFFFQFATPLSSEQAHEITLRREGDGAALPGSPCRLEIAAVFDDEVRVSFERFLAAVADDDLPHCADFLARHLDGMRQRHADIEGGGAQRRHERALGWQEPSVAVPSIPRVETRRALVVDALVPETGRHPVSQAVLSHMRALRRLGYTVHFVSTTLDGPGAVLEAEHGFVCHRRPFYATVEEVLRRLPETFSLIYMHRVDVASRYMALARFHQTRARLLYSVGDLHFLRQARQAAAEHRPDLVEHSDRVRTVEIAAACQADVVVTHSSFEARLLRDQFGLEAVHVVPWSMATRPTPIPFAERSGVAFVADHGHPPDARAARWLVDCVLPAARLKLPDLRCLLAASTVPPWLEALSGGSVTVESHLDELDDLFVRVRLTIGPPTFGAGIEGAVLASLAAGVPCACTSVAAEGLDLPPLLQELVADDPAALATIIERLHEDETFNRSCAEAGLDYARTRLSDSALDASLRLALARRR